MAQIGNIIQIQFEGEPLRLGPAAVPAPSRETHLGTQLQFEGIRTCLGGSVNELARRPRGG